MEYEKSCGAIIYRKDNQKLYYLILQHIEGHWSFPKGHVENSETEIETAHREILEETGLDVSIDNKCRLVNNYSPGINILKEVVYFIAESSKSIIQLQIDELKSMKWCLFNEANHLITYDSDKEILNKANDYILKNYLM